jgi:hypothetical protein
MPNISSGYASWRASALNGARRLSIRAVPATAPNDSARGELITYQEFQRLRIGSAGWPSFLLATGGVGA